MLSGSTHGLAIILVSFIQGLLVDAVLLIIRRHNLTAYMLAGGFSAASMFLSSSFSIFPTLRQLIFS